MRAVRAERFWQNSEKYLHGQRDPYRFENHLNCYEIMEVVVVVDYDDDDDDLCNETEKHAFCAILILILILILMQ